MAVVQLCQCPRAGLQRWIYSGVRRVLACPRLVGAHSLSETWGEALKAAGGLASIPECSDCCKTDVCDRADPPIPAAPPGGHLGNRTGEQEAAAGAAGSRGPRRAITAASGPRLTHRLMPGAAIAPIPSSPSAEMSRHRNLSHATAKKPQPTNILWKGKSPLSGDIFHRTRSFSRELRYKGTQRIWAGGLQAHPGLIQSPVISIPIRF